MLSRSGVSFLSSFICFLSLRYTGLLFGSYYRVIVMFCLLVVDFMFCFACFTLSLFPRSREKFSIVCMTFVCVLIEIQVLHGFKVLL